MNCSSWVNTIFKHAKVPKDIRKEAGDFRGVDWAEFEELNPIAFGILKDGFSDLEWFVS